MSAPDQLQRLAGARAIAERALAAGEVGADVLLELLDRPVTARRAERRDLRARRDAILRRLVLQELSGMSRSAAASYIENAWRRLCLGETPRDQRLADGLSELRELQNVPLSGDYISRVVGSEKADSDRRHARRLGRLPLPRRETPQSR